MKGFLKLDENLFVAKDMVESIKVFTMKTKKEPEYSLILYFKEKVRFGGDYSKIEYHTKLQKSVKECFEYLQGGENE